MIDISIQVKKSNLRRYLTRTNLKPCRRKRERLEEVQRVGQMQQVDFCELEADEGNGETKYWQGRPFTGVASVSRPDGKLWGEIEYVSGRRYKISHEWYPSGRIRIETIYRDVLRPDASFRDEIKDRDALRPKIVRRWFASGQMEYEAFYHRGSLYGPNRSWDEAGRLRQETIHEHNFPVWMRMWDEAGRLTYEQAIGPGCLSYPQLQNSRERYDKYLGGDQKAWVKALVTEERKGAEIFHDPLLHQ